jgi:hypothetical protein
MSRGGTSLVVIVTSLCCPGCDRHQPLLSGLEDRVSGEDLNLQLLDLVRLERLLRGLGVGMPGIDGLPVEVLGASVHHLEAHSSPRIVPYSARRGGDRSDEATRLPEVMSLAVVATPLRETSETVAMTLESAAVGFM